MQQLAQKNVQGQQKLEENVKNDVNRGDNDIIEDKVNVIKDEDEVRQEDSNYDSSSQTSEKVEKNAFTEKNPVH